jgi:hypothetical protein
MSLKLITSEHRKTPLCCPAPVKCEYETNLLLNTVEFPLNRDIVVWESTELIKGTFSIRNISTDAVMTVRIQYKDGETTTRVLEPGEGFMITDCKIVLVSIRFSSDNAEAIGAVRFESCTENILEQNKKEACCPHPLICRALAAEAENIASNENYLLWHTNFPVEAMMEFLLYEGETATIMIERYGKSTITETISFAVSQILVVDHIKRVYVKVHRGVGSIFMETCMQEELPLKGDEDDGITVINS